MPPKGIYKTDEKKKLQGKDINLELGGKKIISSPLMINKASENYVPKIQGAPLISQPNRTDQTMIFMSNGKTIELMP